MSGSTALTCANCGRAPRPNESAEDSWRANSDGAGELLVFLPRVRRGGVRL